MQLIDPTHKFYRPLGVRVAVVAVCAFWFAVEAFFGASFWLVIVGALTVYSAYVLLYRYDATMAEADAAAAAEAARKADEAAETPPQP